MKKAIPQKEPMTSTPPAPEPLDADRLGGLYDEARAHEDAGETDAAAALFHQCLALDPADHCGVTIRLAAMGAVPTPQKAPDAYVATLFDQHAAAFDKILTQDLEYAVPTQIAAMVQAHGIGPLGHVLDLGCGTGLCGLALNGIYDHLVGVDLSEKMIDQAHERDVYDLLYKHEAIAFLDDWHRASQTPALKTDYHPFDTIIAADVLPYIGALEPLAAGIAAVLAPGGRFIFSCETLADEAFAERGWTLTGQQRFAHHHDYLTTCFGAVGFTSILRREAICVRFEEGVPLPGYLMMISSPAPASSGDGGAPANG
ncbi:MAG: methyltransferase domain-containing protein [Pseudomonadota bacterium]